MGKNLSKYLDLAQELPNKLLFRFLWVKMFAKKYPRFSDGPEIALFAKSAKDFEMAAVTEILGRRDKSIAAPLLSTENRSTHQTKTHTACMYVWSSRI